AARRAEGVSERERDHASAGGAPRRHRAAGGASVDTPVARLLTSPTMASASVVAELECLRCHAVYDDQRLFTGCPRCAEQSVNVTLTVRVPAAARGPLTPESFPAAPRSLWRFRRLL